MNPPPPPQDGDKLITQFQPCYDQWELNEENFQRIEPSTGHTILHNYCRFVNTTPLEMYRYLIETKGCDVNVRDKDNFTPLLLALFTFSMDYDGEVDTLLYLLQQYGTDINVKGQLCGSLLHYACFKINNLPIQVFKHLISIGADFNAKYDDGSTLLHFALSNVKPGCNTAIITYLLTQSGVNTMRDKYGRALLHLACQQINLLPLDVYKVLIERHDGDVNIQDNSKRTPLHYAFVEFKLGCNDSILKYLLTRKNIDLTASNKKGNTLLHLSCMLGNAQTNVADNFWSGMIQIMIEGSIQ
jgi:ankyrin repeat protein